MRAAVAASGTWKDEDGIRMPSGDVHAWQQGTNQTVCGLSLYRSRLVRFPHVDWLDVQPPGGRHAEMVDDVCPRCAATMVRARGTRGRGPIPSRPRGRRPGRDRFPDGER